MTKTLIIVFLIFISVLSLTFGFIQMRSANTLELAAMKFEQLSNELNEKLKE